MLASLSSLAHRRSVCITKFICLDASRLANFVDSIPRATIKIVNSLQGERSFLGCFRMNNLFELLAQ